jgi:hypothetical protein
MAPIVGAALGAVLWKALLSDGEYRENSKGMDQAIMGRGAGLVRSV